MRVGRNDFKTTEYDVGMSTLPLPVSPYNKTLSQSSVRSCAYKVFYTVGGGIFIYIQEKYICREIEGSMFFLIRQCRVQRELCTSTTPKNTP